jgi:glycerol kinase
MAKRIISIDQSTSATKAFLFDEHGKIIRNASLPHRQYYPKEGWVEHDAMEIYDNTVAAIKEVAGDCGDDYSIAITNQRETVVVWSKSTGKPVYNAVVWQDLRGKPFCDSLKAKGLEDYVMERSGLLIDPYFAGSGAKWVLDNVPGARKAAEEGDLLMGTVDSWLVWKLTGGKTHATDFTNASRTLLFNIHTLDWDDDLLKLFTIPRSMLPEARPSDAFFGETDVEGLFGKPVPIAGVIGDSHGALVGQMCFTEGLGKATYGTGSSVMVNIGLKPAPAPEGLVTSVGFAALGKVWYAFEGNIHSTGATLKWLADSLGIIGDPSESEAVAASIPDNGGVYLVPAFAGLGAPYWSSSARAVICGMTFSSGKAQIVRAGLESIAYQVADLLGAMTEKAGITLRELRVDGGPTHNKFLMHFQSDLIGAPVLRATVEDASAFGAFLVNGFSTGRLSSFEDAGKLASFDLRIDPDPSDTAVQKAYEGWGRAVRMALKY